MQRLALALVLAGCACAPGEDVPSRLDSDGDTILDVHEGEADPDGDGMPAYLDLDSDGDGVPDAAEAGDADLDTLPFDVDGDGEYDIFDLDSDGNGMPDAVEAFDDAGALSDRDGDGFVDSSDLDDDDDGVPDIVEMNDGEDRNSDATGRPDRLDPDSDGDHIPDAWEGPCDAILPCDTDGDGTPDLIDDDSDGDGLSDAEESGVSEGLAEPPADTDGDGLYDARDLDRDGDGLPDADEVTLGSDPSLWDTDGDGLADGLEVTLELDPTDPASRFDGAVIEAPARDDGRGAVTSELAIDKVDVVWLVPAANGFGEFLEVHKLLLAEYLGSHDILFAAASVGSYGLSPWSPCKGYDAPSDCPAPSWTKPWTPLLPLSGLTRDARGLSYGLSIHRADWQCDGVSMGCSGALPAPLEAMRHVLTGSGLDLNCNGVFDPLDDLPVIPPQSDDLFGGLGPDLADIVEPVVGQRGPLGLRDRSHILLLDASNWDGTFFARPDVKRSFPARTWPEGVWEPGTCPPAASLAAVTSLISAGNVDWLLPDDNPYVSYPDDLYPWSRDALADAAIEAGSWKDPDGDGIKEHLSILGDGGADDRSTFAALRDKLHPTSVSFEARDDPRGLVRGFEPAVLGAHKLGDTVSFEVLTRGTVPPTEGDQGFIVTIATVGNLGHDLDVQQVLIVVPGWGRHGS